MERDVSPKKREQIRRVIQDQLKEGKSLQEIQELAVSAGIPSHVFLKELSPLFSSGENLSFLPFADIEKFLQKKKRKFHLLLF
jgi:hypothetical protein